MSVSQSSPASPAMLKHLSPRRNNRSGSVDENETAKTSNAIHVQPRVHSPSSQLICSGSSVEFVIRGDNIGEQQEKQRESTPASSTDVQVGQSHKNKNRLVSLPCGIDPNNVIDYTEDIRTTLAHDALTSSVPPSSYALRNRGAKRSKLAYDVKYHPMDDSIRPSQAAKRRSVHGEIQLLSEDSCDKLSEELDTDAESLVLTDNESEVEENPKQAPCAKKRKNARPCSSVATRRSSRTTSCPRKAYNMKVHPQDEELQILSGDETIMRVPARKRKRLASVRPTIELDSDDGGSNVLKGKYSEVIHVADSNDSDGIEADFEASYSVGQMEPETSRALFDKSSSPLSTISVAPLPGIRQKEGLDAWQLRPGQRYFRHDRDSWPSFQGQPFEIFEEHLEDQLAAEAKLLSPLQYEHDNKENSVNESVLPVISQTEGDISVIPVSQYRMTNEDNETVERLALVNHALYDTSTGIREPYGIESSDGAQEERLHCSSAFSDNLNGPPKGIQVMSKK